MSHPYTLPLPNFVLARTRQNSRHAEMANFHAERADLFAERAALHTKAAALHTKLVGLQTKKTVLMAEQAATLRETTAVELAIGILDERIRTDNRLSSLLRRTPAEILCEIFQWTLPQEYTRTVRSRVVPTAPWRLTHICRAWRAAAQGDTRLWSHIRIDTRPSYPRYDPWSISGSVPALEYPLAALEKQIQLSANALLSVDFRLGVPVPDPQHVIQLLSLLVRKSNRWLQLNLGWAKDTGVIQALSEIKGHLAQLRHLRLDRQKGDNFETSEWPTELQDIFAVAPRLREALLADESVTDSPRISISWQQLTKLNIRCTPGLLCEILLQAVNLVDCQMQVSDPDTTSSFSDTIVVLPNLRRLSSWWSDWYASCLEAPNLEYLDVTFEIGNLATFLNRSQCELRTLKLDYCTGTPAAVVTLLQHVPRLSHFEISTEYDAEVYYNLLRGILPAMRASGTSTDLCPRLSSIHIALFDHEDETRDLDDSLCDMIESRWNLPPGLRSLQCVRITPGAFYPSVWERFEALRYAGLDLSGPTRRIPTPTTSDDDEDST
ncbi:hypothetical protein DFH08DRAFT_44195 [Mycena albidolilacea]|uniref:F-box domain-containing protein n=1 Tax=Mycena albidolilacea TaxID=1033008 RepID=A0AAD7EVL4_9AGAR|nr:hypothetical protein DFH08DRAFT_44195 [Mycena albidolilacea]